MRDLQYGDLFRDAYSLLHGGRQGAFDTSAQRTVAEPIEEYLARTRSESLGLMRNRLLAAEAPPALQETHRLLLELIVNALAADEALAEQVRAYQCGQFHESVTHSDHLQDLVVASQRTDRELISNLRGLPPETLAELAIDV